MPVLIRNVQRADQGYISAPYFGLEITTKGYSILSISYIFRDPLGVMTTCTFHDTQYTFNILPHTKVLNNIKGWES